MSEFKKIFRRENDKSLDNIQRICRSLLPSELARCPWSITGRGGNEGDLIYDDEMQLNAYMAAYIQWHKGKLFHTFDKLPKGAVSGDISIVDWGCGQGMATLCLYEYAKFHKLKVKVKEIILIEPSTIALDRAKFIVSQIDPNVTISTENCKIEAVTSENIKLYSDSKVFHIFSNVLDVKGINLKHLSHILFNNSRVDNYDL